MLYYVLNTPGCYTELQKELDSLSTQDTSSNGHAIKYSSARELPYLHACIQETFRIHPPFGENLERVVPSSGATICGHFIPGGTIVGCGPGVIHHDKTIFGDDVDSFRPDRWLETLENGEAIRRMERTMFQFGAGNHLCLGKNIATAEVYKFIPSLLKRFEVCPNVHDLNWRRPFDKSMSLIDQFIHRSQRQPRRRLGMLETGRYRGRSISKFASGEGKYHNPHNEYLGPL